jgi:hypothetical protein
MNQCLVKETSRCLVIPHGDYCTVFRIQSNPPYFSSTANDPLQRLPYGGDTTLLQLWLNVCGDRCCFSEESNVVMDV